MIQIEPIHYPVEELIPIVAGLASGYCGYEHTSVTYETAQGLMEAVLYCINECINEPDNRCDTPLIQDISAKDAYLSGQNIVKEKVRELREIYNRLIPDFEDYNCKCLRQTVTKEIPRFLSGYDFKYAPQETLVTLDYPVLKHTGGLSGIDAVLEYMKCIELEQRFLKAFDRGFVIEILHMYYYDDGLLFENISGIVLQHIIMCCILDKPVSSGSFCPEEMERIGSILGNLPDREAKERIEGIAGGLVEHYYNNDRLLSDYLQCAAPDMAWRLRRGR
ncbi:hypothetical protein D3Z50_06065 [Clostridiaceae bacterium]|nr:hypothetical protein [Clostridiaceae bacterium]